MYILTVKGNKIDSNKRKVVLTIEGCLNMLTRKLGFLGCNC